MSRYIMAFITNAVLCFFSLTGHAAEVSVTIDDFDLTESTLLTATQRNQKILETLAAQNIKSALFVTCKYLAAPEGKALLSHWNEQGHIIGNHTSTHPYFGADVSADSFIKNEILACEKELIQFSQFQKLFRFPMLTEGDTIQKRDQVRSWLKAHQYKTGYVTIDASDWYIDQRMRERLSSELTVDLKKYRDFYLNHIWDRAQYYDELAKKVLHRSPKHTLLLHFNLLNALFLNDLIEMFKSKGWKIIDANQAFKDPIFSKYPNSMPSGQSLIWALAKETGKFDNQLRFPGEDEIYEKPKMDKLGL